MNPIQNLYGRICEAFPDADLRLSQPSRKTGFWSLEATRGEYNLVVEWREADGFGMAGFNCGDPDSDHEIFDPPRDEEYADAESATARVLQLLEGRISTVSPRSLMQNCTKDSDERFKEALEKVLRIHADIFRRLAASEKADRDSDRIVQMHAIEGKPCESMALRTGDENPKFPGFPAFSGESGPR